MNQENRQFAFGYNHVAGCHCPAVAAGENPTSTGEGHIPGLLEAAERYDGIAGDKFGYATEVIGEQDAKECWLEVIEEAQEKRREEMFNAAVRIAKALDWIEEGEYEYEHC